MNSPISSNTSESSKEARFNWLKKNYENENKNEINFQEIFNSLIRRKKLFIFTFITILLSSSSLILLQLLISPIYKGSFKLLVANPLGQSESGTETKDFATQMLLSATGNMANNNMSTLIEFLKSPYVLEDLSAEIGIDKNRFAKMINIQQIKEGRQTSEVLEITLETRKPKNGLDILKKLSKTYVDVVVKQKERNFSEGLKFLESQEPIIRLRTESLQEELRKFQEENSIIFPEDSGKTIKVQQKILEDELRELDFTRSKLVDAKKSIKDGEMTFQRFNSNFNDSRGSSIQLSDIDKGLFAQLEVIDKELAEARTKFSENSKIVKGFLKRRQTIEPLILQSQLRAIDKTLKSNLDSMNTLKQQISDLELQFQKQPNLMKEYMMLEQKLIIAFEDLVAIEKVKKSYQTNLAQNIAPWLIISPAEIGPKPIKPSVPKDFIISGFISFILAILAALWRDNNKNVFYTNDELNKYTNAPFIGSFPYISHLSKIIKKEGNIKNIFLYDVPNEKMFKSIQEKEIIEKEIFLYQESLKNIYTTFKFTNTDNSIKSLAITSSVSSEGKSLITSLFAKTINDLGLRILLVDTDIRDPKIHLRMGLENKLGLSNLLTDEKLKISNIIGNIPNFDSFDVITAGSSSSNSTKIIGSERMSQFVRDISDSKNYDLIIFNTPPIYELADASLISEKVDGIILIASLNNVDKNILLESIKKINLTGSKLLGIISNNIRSKNNIDNLNYSPNSSKLYKISNSKRSINKTGIRKIILFSSFIKQACFEKIKTFKLKFINLLNYLDD